MPSENEGKAWRHFFKAWQNYTSARKELLIDTPALVELVRQALVDPHQRSAALDLARYMRIEQLQLLFKYLLAIAAASRGTPHYARELILTLPREWLVANIEAQAEQILDNEDDEDYRGLFLLYCQIDPELAKRLAQRAVASPNPDIREAGEYFSEILRLT